MKHYTGTTSPDGTEEDVNPGWFYTDDRGKAMKDVEERMKKSLADNPGKYTKGRLKHCSRPVFAK